MALNIFPRREPAAQLIDEPEAAALPEPAEETIEAAEAAADGPKRARRGTRGGRSKNGVESEAAAESGGGVATSEEPSPAATAEAVMSLGVAPTPARPSRARRPRGAPVVATEAEVPRDDIDAPLEVLEEKIEFAAEEATEAAQADEVAESSPPPRSRSRRGRRGSGSSADPPSFQGVGPEEASGEAIVEEGQGEPQRDMPQRRDDRSPRDRDRDRDRGDRQPQQQSPASGDARVDALIRAVEQQSRQIEQLVRAQQDNGRRPGAPAGSAAPPARVGIFVDTANIELASDRTRTRLDWRKILDMLTRDRQLVRAIAYSPIHDDPGVSIETQRFVEPFLDAGYKVVTKPLKRFQDGSIKANVDIELALDVVTMLERLDIVCLVSGDGDFQRLVELAQSKGVRVEVVGMGSSTSTNLRQAADAYIDLQARLRDIRV